MYVCMFMSIISRLCFYDWLFEIAKSSKSIYSHACFSRHAVFIPFIMQPTVLRHEFLQNFNFLRCLIPSQLYICRPRRTTILSDCTMPLLCPGGSRLWRLGKYSRHGEFPFLSHSLKLYHNLHTIIYIQIR